MRHRNDKLRRWIGVWMGAYVLVLIWSVSALVTAASPDGPDRPVRVDANASVRVEARPSSTWLPADTRHKAYIKVSLTGVERPADSSRPPLNICLVLDKSGSMSGEKMAQARSAAIAAIERLHDNDIISVVTYDSTVHVLVPATKVAEREAIYSRLRQIVANGSTALFGGVSKGAAEVGKFLSRERYNHVILLSDGLANVGPSSPGELGELGASLAREGISVSTLGLGLDYNEELMAHLAARSDGNHYFAENSHALPGIFDRALGGALAVVARDVRVEIECADGVRPVRILGRDATIDGQRVIVNMSQVYSEHEKYVLLEVETPAGPDGARRELARVDVSYSDLLDGRAVRTAHTVEVGFTRDAAKVSEHTDSQVMVSAVEQIATEQNVVATRLRDEGKVEEARQVLSDNASFLRVNAAQYDAPALHSIAKENEEDAEHLSEDEYRARRKMMKERQAGAAYQMFE